MFTGLVQGMGRIAAAENRGSETRFRIAPLVALERIVLGESIAVNGACLTVERAEGGLFSVYASAETLAKTTLGRLRSGDMVNLERALALGDRLGGHLVSGHVDCLAEVESMRPAGESMIYRLGFPPEFGTQVVTKGSAALDGISLTVNACGPDFLEVNLIPVTRRETTAGTWKAGVQVNMETDMLGKYVERMLAAWRDRDSGEGGKSGGLSEEFLRRHGF